MAALALQPGLPITTQLGGQDWDAAGFEYFLNDHYGESVVAVAKRALAANAEWTSALQPASTRPLLSHRQQVLFETEVKRAQAAARTRESAARSRECNSRCAMTCAALTIPLTFVFSCILAGVTWANKTRRS